MYILVNNNMNNEINTILFVSLITTMILPFSNMVLVESEGCIDNWFGLEYLVF